MDFAKPEHRDEKGNEEIILHGFADSVTLWLL